MNLPVVYTHMMKVAEEDPEGSSPRTYGDVLHQYQDRAQEYSEQVTTRKHNVSQSLGVLSSALIGVLGGAAIGGLLGGGNGARVGAVLGIPIGIGVNRLGEYYGRQDPPRTLEEQLAYQYGDEGIAKELLIPGYAGYQRGRTAKHIKSVISKETPAL